MKKCKFSYKKHILSLKMSVPNQLIPFIVRMSFGKKEENLTFLATEPNHQKKNLIQNVRGVSNKHSTLYLNSLTFP